MNPVALHSAALDHLRSVAAQVPADRWTSPTNCEPWDASTLLNHAISSQLLWVGAVTGTERIPLTAVVQPTPVDGDPLEALDAAAAEARAAWGTDGVLDRSIVGAFGELPGRDTIVFCTIDPIAHAWDLAVSLGLDADLPDDLLAETERLVDAAVNDTTRQFGLFSDPPELPDDASPTDRIMARTGRSRP